MPSMRPLSIHEPSPPPAGSTGTLPLALTMIALIFNENSVVNFGPVTTEIWRSNRTCSNQLFQKTIFQTLRGATPPNFHTH